MDRFKFELYTRFRINTVYKYKYIQIYMASFLNYAQSLKKKKKLKRKETDLEKAKKERRKTIETFIFLLIS